LPLVELKYGALLGVNLALRAHRAKILLTELLCLPKFLSLFLGKINQREIHRQNPFWPTYRLLCTGSDSNDTYLHAMVASNVSQDSGGQKSVVTQDLRS
jgi:hypothetical protein